MHEMPGKPKRGAPPRVDRLQRPKAEIRKGNRDPVGQQEQVATTGAHQRAEFHDLVGKWIPDPEFDEIIRSLRQIDWPKWK